MYHTPVDETPRTRRPRATPEQMAARELLAKQRRETAVRKQRTRRLIQMGGVMARYGFEDADQVEETMQAVLSSPSGAALVLAAGVRPTPAWQAAQKTSR